jgi:hypothetical protein
MTGVAALVIALQSASFIQQTRPVQKASHGSVHFARCVYA